MGNDKSCQSARTDRQKNDLDWTSDTDISTLIIILIVKVMTETFLDCFIQISKYFIMLQRQGVFITSITS